MQFQSHFYEWGCQNKTAEFRHLILLSRVTYWASVEMLSQTIKWCKTLWNTQCLHAWAFHFLKCIVMAFSTLWYPMGTHWITISFHGKTFTFKKLCLYLHSITPLEWGSFESKDSSVPSYASTYFRNLLLLKHYHSLITLWSMYVHAYVNRCLSHKLY